MPQASNGLGEVVDGESDTLMHLNSIARFLKVHEQLWRAHVVDFFQGKLWERVDKQWLACLRHAPAEDWLLLPSGHVHDDWPSSLKEFVQTAHQLSLCREPVTGAMHMSFSGGPPASIGNVLAQGMSVKKLHEIGVLASLIAKVAEARGAPDVIDVGAGQGYLALVLAFEHQLSVVAVDACAHHANVTNERALRIQKHYNNRMRKSQQVGLTHSEIQVPRTVTCRVGSGETPTALASLLPVFQANKVLEVPVLTSKNSMGLAKCGEEKKEHAVVLAGLHACGDLSATMLRTFVECKAVKAVINVGCCYNLLSEETSSAVSQSSGFPLSEGVGRLDLHLGRSARDLACQSAERWRDHLPERAVQNFELHAFRAAFQLILQRFYPETALLSPSVGRSGKARRRRQARRGVVPGHGDTLVGLSRAIDLDLARPSKVVQKDKQLIGRNKLDADCCNPQNVDDQACENTSFLAYCETMSHGESKYGDDWTSGLASSTKEDALNCRATRFEGYARSALERLNLPILSDHDIRSVWEAVAPYEDLVGPFWSLRAALAPVIETYILLDRLLYVKEQGSILAQREGSCGRISAELIPLFDPSISPRNMAIIAHREPQ